MRIYSKQVSRLGIKQLNLLVDSTLTDVTAPAFST